MEKGKEICFLSDLGSKLSDAGEEKEEAPLLQGELLRREDT